MASSRFPSPPEPARLTTARHRTLAHLTQSLPPRRCLCHQPLGSRLRLQTSRPLPMTFRPLPRVASRASAGRLRRGLPSSHRLESPSSIIAPATLTVALAMAAIAVEAARERECRRGACPTCITRPRARQKEATPIAMGGGGIRASSHPPQYLRQVRTTAPHRTAAIALPPTDLATRGARCTVKWTAAGTADTPVCM